MTADCVFIEDLRIQTVIGVFDWEREITQTVSLDLQMDFDIRQAGKSDDIADTLDYKAVSKRLIQFVEASEFQLVEALAEHCAQIVLAEFPVSRVQLKLSKPGAVRGSSAVGVMIERGSQFTEPSQTHTAQAGSKP
jgi:dihydroneopterin aldolase